MHWFLDPITKHYADFAGRASRQQYWMFFLFNFLISIGVGVVSEMVTGSDMLATIYSLALLIPALAIGARRLHDIGRSAWWLLLIFVPVLGWIVLLVFYVTKGDVGENAYGAPINTAAPASEAASVSTEPTAEAEARTLREQAEHTQQ